MKLSVFLQHTLDACHVNVHRNVNQFGESTSHAFTTAAFQVFFHETSVEEPCEGSRVRQTSAPNTHPALSRVNGSKWIEGGGCGLVGGWCWCCGSGRVLGHSSVKNYLYSCFMMCSGGVCFKVLPGDWQCVTKKQTHAVLKRRNWLICWCWCWCV